MLKRLCYMQGSRMQPVSEPGRWHVYSTIQHLQGMERVSKGGMSSVDLVVRAALGVGKVGIGNGWLGQEIRQQGQTIVIEANSSPIP